MASRELKVEIIGDSRSLEKALGRAANSSSKFGSTMTKTAKVVGLAMVGLGAAVTAGFVYTLKRGFDELAESQKVMAQTEAVLKSTGGVANVTAKEVAALAESQSKLTGIDDELIQANENLLLTFKQVRNEVGAGNDIFDRATKASLDLSTAGFGSLDSTAKQLGKALNDPIKGMTALSRAGVTFTASQKETIKSLVESGRTLDAQKLILREVESQVGGSAKAYGETLPGQLAKARNAFDEIAGNLAVKFLPMLTSVLEWVNKNWPTIEAVIDAVGTGIIATFNAIGVAVGYLRNQWEIHRETVIATWNTVQQAVMKVIAWFQTNIVPPIRAIIAAAIGIWNNFGGEIMTIGGRLVQSVKITIQNMLAPMKILFALLRGDWSAAWEEAKAVVTRTLGGMVANIKVLLGSAASVAGTLAAKIGKAILDGITGALESAAKAIFGVAARIVLGIVEPFTHLPSFLGAPFRAAKDAINKQLGIIKTESGNVAQQTGYSVGFFMGMGLNAGIAASTAAAVETARQAALKVAEALRTAAQTKSPSKVTMEIGKDMGLGLAMGLAQALADASPAAKDKARAFMGEATNILDTVRTKGYDIGNKQVQAVIDGILGKTPSLKQQIMTAIDEANTAALQRVAAAKQQWADAWGQLAQAGMDAIDAKFAGYVPPSQQILDKMSAEEAEKQVLDAVAAAQAALDAAEFKAAEFPPLKPGEVASEEWKKAEAELLAAQAALAEAELAAEKYRLAQIATLEQKAHDDMVANEKKNFAADLARLQKQVADGTLTWKEGQQAILKLFKSYGIDYRKAGKTLGEEFAKGIKDGIAAVGSAVEELAEAIAAKLKGKSPPKEGPLRDIDRWGLRLLDAFLSGFNANLINKELNKIKVPDTFQRPPMLEGLSQWTEQSFGGVAEPGGSPFASMGIPPGVNSSLYQFAATLALAAGKFDEFVEDMWKGRTNARILDLLFQNRTRWNWAQFPPWIASILNTMRDLGLSGAEAAPMYGLARGGIITSPTRALIGEAGPEAVVPLSRYRGGMGGKVVVNIGTVVGTPTRAIADAWATEIDSALARKRGRTGALALD